MSTYRSVGLHATESSGAPSSVAMQDICTSIACCTSCYVTTIQFLQLPDTATSRACTSSTSQLKRLSDVASARHADILRTVSRWDRLLVFGGLNLAAIALFVVCFTLLPILTLRPRKFAIL